MDQPEHNLPPAAKDAPPPLRIPRPEKPRLSLRTFQPGSIARQVRGLPPKGDTPPIIPPLQRQARPMMPPPAPGSIHVESNPFRRSTGKTLDALIDRSAPPWKARLPVPLRPGEALLGEPETPAVEGMPNLDPTSPSGVPQGRLAEWESELEERDRQLRRAKALVDEKERAVYEQEMLLKARERYIAESENLLRERQRALASQASILEISNKETAEPEVRIVQSAQASEEIQQAIDRLKKELDERDERIKQTESMLEEREAYVLESEQVLFEKAQQLHELETELESLRDELRLRKAKLDNREGVSEEEV